VNGQNGRVNFTDIPTAGGFLRSPEVGFTYRTVVEENASENLLRGNWAENTLSKAFFGPANTKIIQNAIRKTVYDKSGEKKWIIDEQSADELQIIMRSIFLQYAKNWDTQIPEQIRDLNALVIEWTVPRIMSEIEFHQYYIQDISHMPVPLSQPVSLSSAGTKSLPFRRFM
jgi:hypothetical protein